MADMEGVALMEDSTAEAIDQELSVIELGGQKRPIAQVGTSEPAAARPRTTFSSDRVDPTIINEINEIKKSIQEKEEAQKLLKEEYDIYTSFKSTQEFTEAWNNIRFGTFKFGNVHEQKNALQQYLNSIADEKQMKLNNITTQIKLLLEHVNILQERLKNYESVFLALQTRNATTVPGSPGDKEFVLSKTEIDITSLFMPPPKVPELGVLNHDQALESSTGTQVFRDFEVLLRRNENSMLDLEALQPLRGPTSPQSQDQSFIPEKIFVRDCMDEVLNDLIPRKESTIIRRILIGSPGVGKSVLFFLAAIYVASNSDEKHVLFIRCSQGDSSMLAFLMKAGSQNGLVNVHFSIDISKDDYTPVSLTQRIRADFGLKISGNVHIYVDGPNYEDQKRSIIPANCNLCTSAGYPPPNNEERDKVERLVLPGWNEDELTSALKQFNSTLSEDQYKHIYSLVGGRIRDSLKVMQGGEEKFILYVADLIKSFASEKLELAVQNSWSSADPKSSDRLRTMFSVSGGSFNQIVDSKYVLGALIKMMDIEQFLKAFNLVQGEKSLRSVSGTLFELICHLWFEKQASSLSTESSWGYLESTGTGAEGVKQLNQTNMYWRPSIFNFSCIDAALIVGKFLRCLQYTVAHSHEFNIVNFWEKFLKLLPRSNIVGAIDQIEVFFVIPSSIEGNFKVMIPSWQRGNFKPEIRSQIELVWTDRKKDKRRKVPNGFRLPKEGLVFHVVSVHPQKLLDPSDSRDQFNFLEMPR